MPISEECSLNPRKMRDKIIELCKRYNALENMEGVVTTTADTARGKLTVQGGSSKLEMSSGKEIRN